MAKHTKWKLCALAVLLPLSANVAPVALSGTTLPGTPSPKTNAPALSRKLRLVTTTSLLGDLVKQIAAEHGEVTSLAPIGADPHSYEPSLRDVRNIVYADAAFSNYLMLEEHSLMRAIDANLSPRAANVNLAEESSANGVKLIPLVEDVSLNTVWLGLRVRSAETNDSRQGEILTRTGQQQKTVAIKATCVEYENLSAATHPGSTSNKSLGGDPKKTHFPPSSDQTTIHAYLTGTFGRPTRYWDLTATPGKIGQSACRPDAKSPNVSLPVGAHTHLTWAFSHPGVYRLHLEAKISESSQKKHPIGNKLTPANTTQTKHDHKTRRGVVTFLVGSSPEQIPALARKTAVNHGHVDLSARLNHDQLKLELYGDEQTTPSETHPSATEAKQPQENNRNHDRHSGYTPQRAYSLNESVVVVPNRALTQIPPSVEFRFLGRPGTEVYQLAQAVLGKHIHGTLDPHTWHDVKNAMAYLRTIANVLSDIDPDNARYYRQNRDRAVARLERLDAWMGAVISSIPSAKRYLVTTHDAYGYLGAAYGINIAGFVSPNPGVQPSAKELVALNRTLDALKVKAVFLEPNLAAYATTLRELAGQRGIAVCRIYGDTFDPKVHSYIDMMQANALALKECLDPGGALPAVLFPPKSSPKERKDK